MLRLLLDEQISPKIAIEARKRELEMEIVSLQEWENGSFLGMSDLQILRAAANQERTLVTYDQRTMWQALQFLAAEGVDHAGVIFVDDKTVPQSDYGGMIRALCAVWRARRMEQWSNRSIFLTAAKRTK